MPSYFTAVEITMRSPQTRLLIVFMRQGSMNPRDFNLPPFMRVSYTIPVISTCTLQGFIRIRFKELKHSHSLCDHLLTIKVALKLFQVISLNT